MEVDVRHVAELLELRDDASQLSVGRRGRGAWGESGDAIPAVTRAARWKRRTGRGALLLRICGKREVNVGPLPTRVVDRHLEPGRRYTDDDPIGARDLYVFANDRRIAAEATLPQLV